jgi:hypothetical protein
MTQTRWIQHFFFIGMSLARTCGLSNTNDFFSVSKLVFFLNFLSHLEQNISTFRSPFDSLQNNQSTTDFVFMFSLFCLVLMCNIDRKLTSSYKFMQKVCGTFAVIIQ